MSTQQTKAGGGGGRSAKNIKSAQNAATPDTNNSNTNNSKKEHIKTEKEKHIKVSDRRIGVRKELKDDDEFFLAFLRENLLLFVACSQPLNKFASPRSQTSSAA